MSTPADRRRHPRYRVELPMTVVLASDPDALFTGELQDLSVGGCFLRTTLPRADFGNAALSFRRELRAPLVAGRVVRRIASQGFAVSFDRSGPELERLVFTLGALAPELRSDFVAGFLDAAIEVY
jgi:hypothetical protein